MKKLLAGFFLLVFALTLASSTAAACGGMDKGGDGGHAAEGSES